MVPQTMLLMLVLPGKELYNFNDQNTKAIYLAVVLYSVLFALNKFGSLLWDFKKSFTTHIKERLHWRVNLIVSEESFKCSLLKFWFTKKKTPVNEKNYTFKRKFGVTVIRNKVYFDREICCIFLKEHKIFVVTILSPVTLLNEKLDSISVSQENTSVQGKKHPQTKLQLFEKYAFGWLVCQSTLYTRFLKKNKVFDKSKELLENFCYFW